MNPRAKIRGTAHIIFDPPPMPGPVQLSGPGVLTAGGTAVSEGQSVDISGEVRCMLSHVDAERERMLQERHSESVGLRVEFTTETGDRFRLPNPTQILLTPEEPDGAHLAYRGGPAEKF